MEEESLARPHFISYPFCFQGNQSLTSPHFALNAIWTTCAVKGVFVPLVCNLYPFWFSRLVLKNRVLSVCLTIIGVDRLPIVQNYPNLGANGLSGHYVKPSIDNSVARRC